MMKELLLKLNKMELRSHTNSENRTQVLNYWQQLPFDYLQFMLEYNGGVGFIGDNSSYLDLWPIEDIIFLNPYFPEKEFSQKVIIIGSNGSGTLYGYHQLNKYFFKTDEYEISEDEVQNCGNNFLNFLGDLSVSQNT